MARKRAYRNRADYRKGGRVRYEGGGYNPHDEIAMKEGGAGGMYDASGNLIGSGPRWTGETNTATTTPTYTAGDVEQAYADLNAGKVTAAQLASQYGVTEDYVNTNLAAHNAKTAAASQQQQQQAVDTKTSQAGWGSDLYGAASDAVGTVYDAAGNLVNYGRGVAGALTPDVVEKYGRDVYGAIVNPITGALEQGAETFGDYLSNIGSALNPFNRTDGGAPVTDKGSAYTGSIAPTTVTESKPVWTQTSPADYDADKTPGQSGAFSEEYTTGKTQAQKDAEKAAQIQEDVDWANLRGAETDAIHWSSPSNVSQAAQAAMFGGGSDLYDPATGLPYTPEKLMAMLGLDAQGEPLTGTTGATGGTTTGTTTGTTAGTTDTTNTVAAIPADGSYTQAETQAVVDAINSGTVTAAEVAAQFGVTEAQINAEMARQNQVAAGEEVTVADPYADTTTTDDAYKLSPDVHTMPTVPMPIDTTTTAADVAAIPVDADYTQFEIDQVYDALESGAMTVQQVSAQFGATPAQIEAEWARMKQQKAGEAVTGEDPFAEGVYDATKDALEAKKVAASQDATAATIEDVDYKAKPLGMNTASIQSQLDALDAQLVARGLKPDTAQYTAAQEQARAEFIRFAQKTGQINFSIEDFAAATGLTVAQAQNQYYNYNHEGKVPLGLSYNKSVTKATQKPFVPGSYLKDYSPVDTQAMLQKQIAQKIDMTGTITAEDAIKQLSTFSGIDEIDDVTADAITKTVGVWNKAVNNGTVTPANYTRVLTKVLDDIARNKQEETRLAEAEEIRDLTQPVQTAQISEKEAEARKASGVDYIIDPGSFVPKVTGEKAILSESPEAEAASRSAITGTAATPRDAAVIGQIGYEARQRAAVTGEAAKGAAANVVAVVGELPPEIAEAAVEDAETLGAVIDAEPIEVQAAIAALPEEALVSAQMENLLGGMESGNIPAWAKPAVSAVEQNLAARGLGVSTVGRDALFNAIIQTAMPMAQSNAQALQANAAQNLSNEQQANLEEARLNATRRLSNLSNQQTAAAQTAQFAQNIGVLETQQRQQTSLTTAQFEQQTRTQNLQARQRAAELAAQNTQQINSLELGNAQQIELAELEIKNQTEQQNMTAINQERLAEMQVGADFMARNAGFKQQMEMANLSNDQQMRLANLTAQNQADAESLSNAQQTELANLNSKMQTNLAQGRIAAEMNVAQLNVDQQRAITNATTQARIDLTKFSTAQQVELANSQFMQSTTITNMNAKQQSAMQDATALASLDMAAVDQRTKLAVENARNFLQLNVTNLNNVQQAAVVDAQLENQRILSDQAAANAAKQFNATSDNQVNMFIKSQGDAMAQFNSSQNNAMEQFNASEKNRLAAMDEQNDIEAQKFNAQIELQVEQFNNNVENQRDIWNASNAQAIEQANTNWRRQANTANTAAINAANAQNVQNAYGIKSQELDFVWNTLRDEGTFLRKEALDTANQKTNLYITAMNNETNTAINSTGVADGVKNLIDGMFA